MLLTVGASGAASAAEAWDRYAELARWPDWSPQIRGVEPAEGRIAVGLTGAVLGPLGLRVPFRVGHVDETARNWDWQVNVGPVRLWLSHAVLDRAGGCSTTLRVRGPLPFVVGYAPLALLAIRRIVRP